MKIYRIQSDLNEGVIMTRGKYRIDSKLLWELSYDYSHYLKDGTERHQHPDADNGTPLRQAYFDKTICRGSPYIFGVKSVKDLYTWFCPAKIGMYEAGGMFIYEYDIPNEHVIIGTRQVAFDPKYATSINKISHKKLRHVK